MHLNNPHFSARLGLVCLLHYGFPRLIVPIARHRRRVEMYPYKVLPQPSEADGPATAEASPEKTGILQALLQRNLPLQNATTYFILANVLDIVLTNLLLRNDAIEANPFASYVLHRWGFNGMIAFKMLLVAFICVLAQIIALRNLRYAQFVLIAGIVIVGGVVAYSAMLFYQITSGAAA